MSSAPKQPGSKSQVKEAQSDGTPAHKVGQGPPPTKVGAEGSASRNIKRKGGGGPTARKEGVTDLTDDGTLDDELALDPKDPNFVDPNDPDRVSNHD